MMSSTLIVCECIANKVIVDDLLLIGVLLLCVSLITAVQAVVFILIMSNIKQFVAFLHFRSKGNASV